MNIKKRNEELNTLLGDYSHLRRGLEAIPSLEVQLRNELDVLRNQERASNHQIFMLAQLSNAIVDAVIDTSNALSEIVKVVEKRVSNDKEAEQLISRALEEADDESRNRIVEQIRNVDGLLSSPEALTNTLTTKHAIFSNVLRLIDQEEYNPRVLEQVINTIDPGLITVSDESLTKDELKKKIKNVIDEYEKKEQERISRGGPFNYETYEQYQKFLYSLCWKVFKYRPFEEGGPLYSDVGVHNDPNPEFTLRLTEVLKELGINCPQILGITHAMWWYLFMAAFIIYDIYK